MNTLLPHIPHAGLAICTVAVVTGAEIQLFPAGDFRAIDGRPEKVRSWRMTAADAARVVAEANQRTTPYLIDYEHQSLMAADNGQPAPAAGWFKRLEWREGRGLFAVDVEWTERAKGFILAGEYRFISPVFSFDRQSGAVQRLMSAGLTNTPALDGLAAVVAAASLRLNSSSHKEPVVSYAKIAAVLGLLADAGEEKILEGVAALKAAAAKPDPAQYVPVATMKAVQDELAALKATAAKPDLTQHAPVAALKALQDELAALKQQQISSEVNALVEQGVKDGKLLPAMKEWAVSMGQQNVAALKQYLDASPPIAALTATQTKGKAPAAAGNGLTEEEVAVCRAMGVTPDAFKKTRDAGGVQ